MAPDDIDYAGSITFMDIREDLPMVDPENLSPQNVLEILLYLFQKKPGFVDRGPLNEMQAMVQAGAPGLVQCV